MILRFTFWIAIAFTYLCTPALTQQLLPNSPPRTLPSSESRIQDMSKTVLPINELKLRFGLELASGTGFCVDAACRFIGTNYHVAMIARPRKIKGEKVVRRYLATGPDDDEATVNSTAALGPMKYTLDKDLAVFELRRPLTRHHGIAFSLNELQVGQEVEIYAYPKEGINPIRELLRFSGKFKGETTTGLLAFDYQLSGDKAIRPGASGGIVVDRKTRQIVGILNGIDKNDEPIALAVPTESLAEFLIKTQPFLAYELFPSRTEISPVSADFYLRFEPPTPTSGSLHHRVEEPAEIKLLRSKAEALIANIRHFVAVQNITWGSERNGPEALSAYEVQVLDGHETYREYPSGNKILREISTAPLPLSIYLRPNGMWYDLPRRIGAELGVYIHEAPNVVVDGHQMRVFQFWATAEDGVCGFTSTTDYLFFVRNKVYRSVCYGEVWTDLDANIRRISQHFDDFDGWKDFDEVVTYDWLKYAHELPRLIPVTFFTQGRFNKKVYWSRGEFTNYRIFEAQSRIIPN